MRRADTNVDRRRHVLDLIKPRLEEDGYTVFVGPARSQLPTFMGNYAPDAVAIGGPKNLAIEIVPGSPAGDRLSALTERFAAQTDWDLRVYYYQPETDEAGIESMPRATIEAAAGRVEALARAGAPDAALLLGWGTLEAAGRHLLPEQLSRSRPPGRLLEVLAREGIVTPDEADGLRELLALRNRIAHGDLGASVSPEQIADLTGILRLALSEADAG